VTEASKPARSVGDPAQLLLGYLDYFRAVIAAKIDGLDDTALRTSWVPSGWSPLELVKHLVYMERRWLRWGFLAEQVDEPLGDEDAPNHWAVRTEDTAALLVEAMHAGGVRTREIVEAAALDDVAALGGRFQPGDEHPAPTLAWILQHVFEEYARHAGHLDVARELADGRIGEH
jgi:uncharacterized damage-inducible protein DinB